jgi:hypothetical protein
MMKLSFYILFLLLSARFTGYAQTGLPQPVTKEVLRKFIAEVREEADEYAATLKQKYDSVAGELPRLSEEALKFSKDSFSIERMYNKRTNIDYSTAGINEALAVKTEVYQRLTTRYFDKLIRRLAPEDRKTLIAAQDAWTHFCRKESELMNTLAKEPYSGSGTIRSNIIQQHKAESMKSRAVMLFTYYNTLMQY